MRLRNISANDVGLIRSLVANCPPLGLHTAFTYWVVGHFFGRLSYVAEEDDGSLVALSTAIRSVDQSEVAYLWQIGVAEKHRGKRLASELIVRSAHAARDIGCRELQVSINPENLPSRKACEHAAARLNTTLDTVGALSFMDPIGGKSENETLFRMLLKC